MSPDHPAAKHGFTLLEIAVVMIIIALIVGSVLVGRELIRNAQIRQMITQIEKYNTAVNTFRAKYKCLPGDCANAADFGFGDTGGDGDGSIGAFYTDPTHSDEEEFEPVDFWYHLSFANLIPDTLLSYDDWRVQYPGAAGLNSVTPTFQVGYLMPAPALKSTLQPLWNGNVDFGWSIASKVQYHTPSPMNGLDILQPHYFFLAHYASLLGDPNVKDQAGYSPVDMYAIDSKIDDGLPLNGNAKAWWWIYRGLNPALPPIVIAAAPRVGGQPGAGVDWLTVDDPPQYRIINTTNVNYRCNLMIKAAF